MGLLSFRWVRVDGVPHGVVEVVFKGVVEVVFEVVVEEVVAVNGIFPHMPVIVS
jgi:hypothetical protein